MTSIQVPLGSGKGWRSRLLGMSASGSSKALTYGLLLSGVAAWVLVGMSWLDARQAADLAQSQRQGQIELRAAASVRPRVVASPLDDRLAADAAAAVRRLNFPWPAVLDDIELFTPQRVSILELSPDAGREQVQMLVQAPRAEDVFEMVERMKESRALSGTRVARFEARPQDAGRAVQFLLQADLSATAETQQKQGAAR